MASALGAMRVVLMASSLQDLMSRAIACDVSAIFSSASELPVFGGAEDAVLEVIVQEAKGNVLQRGSRC